MGRELPVSAVHAHGSPVTATGRHRRRLLFVAALTAATFVGQVVGGLVVAAWVLLEAVQRVHEPVRVSGGLMLGVAAAGALANLVGVLLLRGAQAESLNVRGAYLEVLGDLIGSVLVTAAAVVVTVTGFTAADALASVAVVALLVPRAQSVGGPLQALGRSSALPVSTSSSAISRSLRLVF